MNRIMPKCAFLETKSLEILKLYNQNCTFSKQLGIKTGHCLNLSGHVSNIYTSIGNLLNVLFRLKCLIKADQK